MFPALKRRLEFAYDHQSRRIRKVVKNWDADASALQISKDLRFVYDGWNLIEERDALNGGAVVRKHVWGPDISGTMQGAGGVGGLLWTTTPTQTFAASSDANGNIVAWINTTTLAVAGRADYSPFGEPVVQTGIAKDLPFGFSTKYEDSESGLLYYGFRYLNPATGRFLNRDPIEELGGMNLYGFVQNDQINHWDYLGLLFGLSLDDAIQGIQSAICGQTVSGTLSGEYTIPTIPYFSRISLRCKLSYSLTWGCNWKSDCHNDFGDLSIKTTIIGSNGWSGAKSTVKNNVAESTAKLKYRLSGERFMTLMLEYQGSLSESGMGRYWFDGDCCKCASVTVSVECTIEGRERHVGPRLAAAVVVLAPKAGIKAAVVGTAKAGHNIVNRVITTIPRGAPRPVPVAP